MSFGFQALADGVIDKAPAPLSAIGADYGQTRLDLAPFADVFGEFMVARKFRLWRFLRSEAIERSAR